VRKSAASLFRNKFLLPKSGKTVPEDVIKGLEKEVESVLQAMETFWLKDTDFIAGRWK
jgi:hypothetical protein